MWTRPWTLASFAEASSSRRRRWCRRRQRQMGSFGRRLGQLAARSLESESTRILKAGSANKRGLSKLLDATLREGHDMQTFGLGTAAALASRERYGRFTSSVHAVYDRMEASLDRSSSIPNALVRCMVFPVRSG